MAGGSAYGQTGSSGGSAYGSSGSSGGSPYGGAAGIGLSHGAKTSGGGGLFGWLSQKAALAGHDIAAMPGGVYDVAKATTHDIEKAKGYIGLGSRYGQGKWETPALAKGMAKSTVQSIEHPLRDPFQTALNVAPVADVVGRIGEAGIAAKAADAADESRIAAAARTALRRHGADVSARTLKLGNKEVNLIPSRNAGARLVQRGYDRIVQKAMDTEQSGAKMGRATEKVAAHGVKRFKGVLAEEERAAQRMREVPSNMLDQSASRLNLGKLPRTAREHQAALELTSNQTMPEEAALYHEAQAAKGVNPEQNAAIAKLYRRVQQRNLVHMDESRPVGEQVHINPAEKHLAMTDEHLAGVGNRGDQMLIEHGIMTPEGTQTAIDNPGRVRAGAMYENPTPGKNGVPSQAFQETERRLAMAEKAHGRSVVNALGKIRSRASVMHQFAGRELTDAEALQAAERDPSVVRLSGAVSYLKDQMQRLEAAHEARIKPTGIVGGEEARPGRTHVSYQTSETTAQRGPAVNVSGMVKGKAASPITSHEFTGEAIRQGLIPNDITGMKSRAFRLITRHENNVQQARSIYETGSDVSRGTGNEMLFANPDAEGALGKITSEHRQFLGQEKATADKASELTAQEHNAATEQGLHAALDEIRSKWFSKSHEQPGKVAGLPAPDGYRWVDKRLAQDLQEQVSPKAGRGRDFGAKVGRAFDNVNSAVTFATVYFKVGHAFTRGFTNAVTNIMQGSMHPLELAKTWQLEKDAKAALGSKYAEFRQRLLAASGQMGYSALPHEGTEGMVGRFVSTAARKGSGFWAHGAGRFPGFDAPFRINSLLYELRKAGYNSVDEVSKALDSIQNGGRGLPAHEWSKLSAAFRRADREAISYDRLSPFERNFVSRAIWFYPWVKGSTMWTLRSIVEHPYKMSVSGNLGVQGRNEQMRELGPVPSYEQGLIDVGGNPASPYTVDMSTFSPAATAGQLLNIPNTPGGLAQQFNPALASIIQGATGTNQYGEPSNNPWGDALMSLIASTPESQLAGVLGSKGKNTSAKMFPNASWQSTLRRYLLGPGLARRPVNRAALAKAASREHAKRYTVYSGG